MGDRYIPIDDAVAYIRDEVPTLIQLIRERVDTISQTRAELEQLLGRVDQEKVYINDCVCNVKVMFVVSDDLDCYVCMYCVSVIKAVVVVKKTVYEQLV